MTAALDSGVLTSRLSDALENVHLELNDLRALIDQWDGRRKWDLKGVHACTPYEALPEEGLR